MERGDEEEGEKWIFKSSTNMRLESIDGWRLDSNEESEDKGCRRGRGGGRSYQLREWHF